MKAEFTLRESVLGESFALTEPEPALPLPVFERTMSVGSINNRPPVKLAPAWPSICERIAGRRGADILSWPPFPPCPPPVKLMREDAASENDWLDLISSRPPSLILES